MKIKGREIDMRHDFLNKVTYVPSHAKGNAGHKDCEQGVIIDTRPDADVVLVLFCNGRTTQAVNPDSLVWG